MSKLFVEIILPVPLKNTFTYYVPNHLTGEVEIGKRVSVSWGKKSFLVGIIQEFRNDEIKLYDPKPIIEILDKAPLVSELQLKFWNWLADYYMAPIGNVFEMAIPSNLRIEREEILKLSNEINLEDFNLLPEEKNIIKFISNKKFIKLKEIQKEFKGKGWFKTTEGLINSKILVIESLHNKRYKPKTEKYLSIGFDFNNKKEFEGAFQKLNIQSKKQKEVLLQFIGEISTIKNYSILKKEFIKKFKIGSSVLKSLTDKGLIIEQIIEISRIEKWNEKVNIKIEDNFENLSVENIRLFNNKLEEKVTVYREINPSKRISLISHYIRKAISTKEVLWIFPNIVTAIYYYNLLKPYFKERIILYNSLDSAQKQSEKWKKINSNDQMIVLGVRSSIFLPFNNLGLVIIEEEYDSSYKMEFKSPMLNLRDSGIYLSLLHKSKTILSTDLLSIDTKYNINSKKYNLFEQKNSCNNSKENTSKNVQLINLAEAHRKKRIKGIFANEFLDSLKITLEQNKQAFVFQNRRGYSPIYQCRSCGYIPKCVSCDVNLTVHKHDSSLKCHYCGYKRAIPSECDQCKSKDMNEIGFGTEQIEEIIDNEFPNKTIFRLDADTQRKNKNLEEIIFKFKNKEIDILIGTQLVLPYIKSMNINFIGIVNADIQLSIPNYKTNENVYLMLKSIYERLDSKNKLLIQSYRPKHPVFKSLNENISEEFILNEIENRKEYHYPPYNKMIQIILKNSDELNVKSLGNYIVQNLSYSLGEKKILGPEPNYISKIRNEFIYNILIKVDNNISIVKTKKLIEKIINKSYFEKKYRKIKVVINVDP